MSSDLNLGTLRGYLEMDDSPLDGALDKALDKIGDFLKSGKGKVVAGGAAIAVALGGSLLQNLNLSAAQDKVAAQLGLTEAESARIGKLAGKVYAGNYGESLGEVNNAIAAVMTSIDGMGNASNKVLQRASQDALNFASTFEVDLNRAVSSVGTLINSGLAKNSRQAFDLLIAASQRVPAHLREDVLDASDEYAQFFHTLGITGQEAFGMLVDASKKGMFGIDKLGDAVKEFTIRSTDMSTASKDAYKVIGLNARETANAVLAGGQTARKATGRVIDGLLSIENPAKRANAAIALFGTPLEDLNVKDIPEFLKSLKGGGKAMDGFRGSAKKVDDTLAGSASATLERWKRKAQQAFLSLTDEAVPAIDDIVSALDDNFGPALEALGNVLEDVFGFIKDNKPVLITLTAVIGALTAVTVAHQLALAISTGTLKAWFLATKVVTTATKVWTAVQWAMNAALTANPIGLVIVAVAALVAGIIIAYKKSETFRKIVEGAFKGIAEAGKWMWNNVLQPVFRFLMEAIAKAIELVAKMLYALSHVPGFGWVRDLADKLQGAADKANALADGINKIRDKTVHINVVTTATGAKIPVNPGHGTVAGIGATGGVVTRPTMALIGEAGPEAVVPLNRTPGSSPLPAGDAPGGWSSFDHERATYKAMARALGEQPMLRVPKDTPRELATAATVLEAS